MMNWMRVCVMVCIACLFTGFAPVYAQKGSLKSVKLPAPRLKGNVSVEQAMVAKRSVRHYGATPLSQEELGQILWAANGNLAPDAITGPTRKVIPSAGGLYPLEIFVLTGNGTVDGLPAGIFSYNPKRHALIPHVAGDQRRLCAAAAYSQMWLSRAQTIVVIGAVFAKTTWKYPRRGKQYVFMEAGSSDQNIYLQATALGLRTATVGAFTDKYVKGALKLPKKVHPLLIVAVGK